MFSRIARWRSYNWVSLASSQGKNWFTQQTKVKGNHPRDKTSKSQLDQELASPAARSAISEASYPPARWRRTSASPSPGNSEIDAIAEQLTSNIAGFQITKTPEVMDRL